MEQMTIEEFWASMRSLNRGRTERDMLIRWLRALGVEVKRIASELGCSTRVVYNAMRPDAEGIGEKDGD